MPRLEYETYSDGQLDIREWEKTGPSRSLINEKSFHGNTAEEIEIRFVTNPDNWANSTPYDGVELHIHAETQSTCDGGKRYTAYFDCQMTLTQIRQLHAFLGLLIADPEMMTMTAETREQVEEDRSVDETPPGREG